MVFKETTDSGEPLHYSVGAIIEKDGKYLMIDRKLPPPGFAMIAGHLDEGEDPITALHREVKEEGNLTVLSEELLFEDKHSSTGCVKGVKNHNWKVYRVEIEGDVAPQESEVKSIAWYTPEEIIKLDLEPVWELWLKRLKII